MSTETPKKTRLPMLTGLASLFKSSAKSSRRPSHEFVEPSRPPSTRSSLKTEQSDYAKMPTQNSPLKKRNIVFSDEISYSDDYEYLSLPLNREHSKDFAWDAKVVPKKGILVKNLRYSQHVGQNQGSTRNWVGLLISEDFGSKEADDDDDEEEEESITHYTFKHSPQVELGLKKTFSQVNARNRSDSADKGKVASYMPSDILDEMTSLQKKGSNPKKNSLSIFNPSTPTRETYEPGRGLSKKEEFSPHKFQGEHKSHFAFNNKISVSPSHDNKHPSFNINTTTPRVEDHKMQQVFNYGYLPEVKLSRDFSGQLKTDRVEHDRPLYGENPFGTPQKMHSKSNSGFDSSRTNFAFTASSMLKPDQYSGVYNTSGVQRLNIVPNYQVPLPNSYTSTPRKM